MTDYETPMNEDKTPIEEFFHHQRRALEESRKAMEALLPPEFREHSQEAGREFAKGFRVLIDAAIDELKKASEEVDEEIEISVEEEPPTSTGETKIRIEVD